MLKNYFKVALRNIRRDKFYSIINISGLAIGITSCLLIGLFVMDELSYDDFHEKAGRITRLNMAYSSGDELLEVALTGTRPGPLFARTIPGIEGYTRMIPANAIFRYEDNIFEERNVLYADSSILDIFTFPLLAGNPETALDDPGRIVITASMARKYFGDEDPLGKVLRMNDEKELRVSGVSADVPENSGIRFDFIIPFSNLGAAGSEEWFPANYYTYLLVEGQSGIETAEKAIDNYMSDLSPEEIGLPGTWKLTYHLEPLQKIHLYSELEGMTPNGSIDYVYILSLIAILILLIACINYTNLSIARAARRNKEVGMRKVLGAGRSDLVRYFIMESLVISMVATSLAFLFATQLLPLLNAISGKSLDTGALMQPEVLVFLAVLGFAVGMVSGIYPAFRLSGFELVRIFRTGSGMRISTGGLGRSLIIFQFVVSIFLIIATVIIQQQRRFLQEKHLGYNKENVVILPVDRQVKPHYRELKDALQQQPGVVSISAGYDLPTFIRWTNNINATTENGEKNFSTKAIPVDLDFIETLGIKLIAGEDFTPADREWIRAATERGEHEGLFIINESALNGLGWTPDEAIGRQITCGMPGTIKGVVKNFHISSLHQEIPPLVIFLSDRFLHLMYVRVAGESIPEVLAGMEAVWQERIAERPFDYHFLDEDYERLYVQEERSARFISTFAGLAILLAALGLFGLSAFMAVSRTREIGIRKVLGASVREISLMLSKEFLIMVLLACVIAFPLAWYAAGEWLSGFAFHIGIEWWVFAGAGFLAMLISFFTVSLQSVKAAMANPVDSLRNE